VLYGQKDMQETDSHLLARFTTHRDEAAFSELANRYLGLIYHVALRRTGDRQLAEEVSQNVLCAVVRKAAGLARHPDRLPAWLHRATLFESSKAMRSEASHQRRKQLVHPDGIATTGEADISAWNAALPVIDLALDRLPDADRDIVLRHYFEGKSFGQIGAEVSRPAATVQKQCRRALEKLARILRGKGVALSVTALAAGLSAQTAKAAPPLLMKVAAAKALAGAASYSTTSLTLFMAMKSKAVLPLCLLLLATPLAFQQLAISRAASRNEILRSAQLSEEIPARVPSSNFPIRTVSTGTKRITIDMLQRAMKEAQRSQLKYIEFEEMLAALGAGELGSLIPQISDLPDPRDEKMELFRHLIQALAKKDPEKAVRVARAVGFQNISIANTGVHRALFAWASARPDEAVEWLKELASEQPDETGLGLLPLRAAVLRALILADSPRVRELMTLSDHVRPEYILRDAFDSHAFIDAEVADADAGVATVSKFLPWIREFVAKDLSETRSGMDQRQAIQRLLFEVNHQNPMEDSIPGRILETLDLTTSEQRIFAELQAQRILGIPYNTRPAPDRAKVESAARDWLQAHAPDQAEEIFAQSKSIVVGREKTQIENSLRSLAGREIIRDSDILQELDRRDFSEFPEFLPQALEQAGKIKDPTKRAETVLRLETTGKSIPAKP
jgi:RNA polymerase sigma factor (sigma-70 family)